MLLPGWTRSLPVDCTNPTPLFATHWYKPESSWVTPRIRRRFPAGRCRGERRRGAALWSQVRVGAGLPRTSHQKCTVAPAATVSSCSPLEIEAGSVKGNNFYTNHQYVDLSLSPEKNTAKRYANLSRTKAKHHILLVLRSLKLFFPTHLLILMVSPFYSKQSHVCINTVNKTLVFSK